MSNNVINIVMIDTDNDYECKGWIAPFHSPGTRVFFPYHKRVRFANLMP